MTNQNPQRRFQVFLRRGHERMSHVCKANSKEDAIERVTRAYSRHEIEIETVFHYPVLPKRRAKAEEQ